MNKRGAGFIAGLAAALLLLGMPGLVAGQGTPPPRIIFMHHSTGYGVLSQGGVREAFTALGYEFWDHGYNDEGLTDAQGESTGENWDVPGDNTDMDGWPVIFGQEVTDPPENTFSHMLTFDVIMFKSCFPNADIQSEEQFEAYQAYFAEVLAVIDQHPDKLFVAWTIPPLVPEATSPQAAARARRWAEYLTSPDVLEAHPNLAVFDFFSLMADEDGYLRIEYQGEPGSGDSHPNEMANQIAGPLLVAFVDEAYRAFTPGEAPPMPLPRPVEPEEAPAGLAGGVVEDFEDSGVMDRWWTYVNDESQTEFVCDVAAPGFEDGQALQIVFESGGWNTAGCGRDLESGEAWAASDGLAFQWRAAPAGTQVNVVLYVSDPAAPDTGGTPFEVLLETPAEADAWAEGIAWWDDLVKPDWFGDEGLDTFDPAAVHSVIFEVGNTEERQSGTILIDDLRLVSLVE